MSLKVAAKGLCTATLLQLALAQPIKVIIPNSCFAASAKMIGPGSSGGTKFSHKSDLLSGVFKAEMRIGKVVGCRDNSDRFAGI